MDLPEKKSATEPLDLQQKIADTLAGCRPVENSYPYFAPDYQVPFVHIGTERQLFVDNFMLDHLENVVRTFPKPARPAESILKIGELPWEQKKRATPQAALLDPDEGKFKMWYSESLSDDVYAEQGQILCYAESSDGLHWEKPLSTAGFPYEGYRETNIVLQDAGHHIALVLNQDQSNPERKFLLLHNPGDRARLQGKRNMSTVAASPDGRRWTIINEDTPYRHNHLSRAIWDESIQKYIAYSQYSHHWNFLHRKRQVGRQESADFMHWSPKEVVLSSDGDPNLPPHQEFHDMSVRKVGGLYIGIACEFFAEMIWSIRKKTAVQNDANWHDNAHAHLALYCSRDGRQWHRVGGPEAWVENGPPGSIHYGFNCFSLAGQMVHAGKSYIPFSARGEKQHWYSRPPVSDMLPEGAFVEKKEEWSSLANALGTYPRQDKSVSTLILREDGWAELKPAYEQGRIYTRQFVFEGNTLKVNAACTGGYLRVEILDPYLEPYDGFSAEDCAPVCSGDPEQVWHTVQWRGNPDLRSLWNKPCRLCFTLHQASLFSFQFESG